jgi:hypothetical protein
MRGEALMPPPLAPLVLSLSFRVTLHRIRSYNLNDRLAIYPLTVLHRRDSREVQFLDSPTGVVPPRVESTQP